MWKKLSWKPLWPQRFHKRVFCQVDVGHRAFKKSFLSKSTSKFECKVKFKIESEPKSKFQSMVNSKIEIVSESKLKFTVQPQVQPKWCIQFGFVIREQKNNLGLDLSFGRRIEIDLDKDLFSKSFWPKSIWTENVHESPSGNEDFIKYLLSKSIWARSIFITVFFPRRYSSLSSRSIHPYLHAAIQLLSTNQLANHYRDQWCYLKWNPNSNPSSNPKWNPSRIQI